MALRLDRATLFTRSDTHVRRRRTSDSTVPHGNAQLLGRARVCGVLGLLYQIFKQLVKLSPHPKIATLGASYCVSVFNALMCSVGGFWATASLLALDFGDRLLVTDTPSPYWPLAGYAASLTVYEYFAHAFLGWLCYDVLHVFTHFPQLGGGDTIAHHLGFVCLTCLGSAHRVLPFSVAWLLLGEVSSLPLNARWFLINTGRGATKAMDMANASFAISFFIVPRGRHVGRRVAHVRPLAHRAHRGMYSCSAVVVNTICGFIAAGAGLNGYWMVGIVKMAMRGGKKTKE